MEAVDVVKVHINGEEVEVERSWSIYEACTAHGVSIPTLCHHPRILAAGICGVCVVEEFDPDTNMKVYKLACSSKVIPGTHINTTTLEVKLRSSEALRNFLSKAKPAIQEGMYCNPEIEDLIHLANDDLRDTSSFALTRDMTKCVACSRCVRACSQLQAMDVLSMNPTSTGPPLIAGDNELLGESDCISCGQCTTFCPTGALKEVNHVPRVLKALAEKKVVVLQTAPATRVAISECFGKEPGEIATGKLVGAAKEIGFTYVFDTNFTADLTIIEEGHELLKRVKEGGPFPMFTSCCPGWINLMETQYPQFIPNLSTCRSPMMMLGSVVKTFLAERSGINPDNIFMVALMPCTAKKDEIERPQMWRDGKKDVDAVLTTREMGELMKLKGVEWETTQELPYDDPFGESTGGAALFGVSGGVMEAALRTAYEVYTGDTLPRVKFDQCRGLNGVKEAEVNMKNVDVKIAIVNGGASIKKLMDQIISGDRFYHFVEVMICPGGCIGGGGQPQSLDKDVLTKRMKGVYHIDELKVLRKSHENKSVQRLYEQFLKEPLGHLSHKLLHTSYTSRWKQRVVEDEDTQSMEESRMLLLYGSQGGSVAFKAGELAQQLRNLGLRVRCLSMDKYDVNQLPEETEVFLLASTFGDGELPDSAKVFAEQVEDLGSDALSGLNYAVCGFGSTSYTKYCEAAIILNKLMQRHEGNLCGEVAKCDERSIDKGQSEFETWLQKILEMWVGVEESVNEPYPPKYEISLALSSRSSMTYCPPHYHYAHCITNNEISSKNYDRPVHFFEFDLTGSSMSYASGDHIAILPRNDPEKVKKIIAFYHLDPNMWITVRSKQEDSALPSRVTIGELLEQYVDLFSAPTGRFLRQLALFAEDENEREELMQLGKAEDDEGKERFAKFAKEHTCADVLMMYKSATPPLENLISMVPLISPRLYSIASSSKKYPKTVQLAVVLMQWTTPEGTPREGLCTQYLFGLNASERPKIAVQIRKGILIPPDESAPLIMVGLGTGIAPFRGFLQDREYMKEVEGKDLGPALLYFGCRHRTCDFLFEDELENYVKNGILTKMVNAFSHDQAHFIFVQHKIAEDPSVCWEMVRQPKCSLFYCGPAFGVPEAVMSAVWHSMVTKGGMSAIDAQNMLKTMKGKNKIHLESF